MKAVPIAHVIGYGLLFSTLLSPYPFGDTTL